MSYEKINNSRIKGLDFEIQCINNATIDMYLCTC
jgi:hypothetical protein